MNDLERKEIRRQLERLKETEKLLNEVAYNCSSIGLDTMSEKLKDRASDCRNIAGTLEFLIQLGNTISSKAKVKTKV